MTRRPLMAGNWKMNMNTSEAVNLSQRISDRYEKDFGVVDVVLCPPFIDLKSVSNVLAFDRSKIALGAQDVFWKESGAYTGEIAPTMLKEVGCSYCIVGHSERRELFNETDRTVNLKIKALLRTGIAPIICCGESLEVHDGGGAEAFVCAQVEAALDTVAVDSIPSIVIAYEPLWAIGSGRTATPEAADSVCAAIRMTIERLYCDTAASQVRVLYGGSLKPENVKHFMPLANIDGGLVGGASLDADSFIALVKACI